MPTDYFIIAPPEAYSIEDFSSEVSGFEADLVRHPDPTPTMSWRTTTAAACHVVLDLGASPNISLVYLGYLNTTLSTAATWEMWSDDVAGNVTGPSDPVSAARYEDGGYVFPNIDDPVVSAHVLRGGWRFAHALWTSLASPITHRYLRIKIDDPTNTDGLIQVGRVLVSDAYFSPRHVLYGGSDVRFATSGQRVVGGSGRIRTLRAGKYRVASLEYRSLTKEEFIDDFSPVHELVGDDVEVVFVDQPGKLRQFYGTIYGVLSGDPAPQRRTFSRHVHRIEIVESAEVLS